MKVTIVGPVYPYRGGIAHYTSMLAEALESFRYEVSVISFHRQYPSWLYPGTSDLDPSKKEKPFPAKYILDPINPWTWELAVQTILKENSDLILIQWWTTFWSPAYLYLTFRLNQQKKRFLYIIHNVMPHEAKVWDRWLSRLVLSRTQYFITLSSGQKNRLLAIFPKAKLIESALPLYPVFKQNKLSKEEAKKKLGLSLNLPVVLFFGIVRPYKGLKYLLEAVSILKQKDHPLQLYIAGEFWDDVDVYHSRIKELEISDRVTINNRYIPDEEIPLIFSAADAFAAPYVGGTQSGAIKLAITFGLPTVVTSKIAEEVFKEQKFESIQVVPPENVELLAEGIIKALSIKLREQNTSVADQYESGWQKLMQDIEDLIKS